MIKFKLKKCLYTYEIYTEKDRLVYTCRARNLYSATEEAKCWISSWLNSSLEICVDEKSNGEIKSKKELK